MALIKCPECSKEASGKADACVHCGYPLKKEIGLTFEEEIELEKAFLDMEALFENNDFGDESNSNEEHLCCNKCYSSKLSPIKKGFSAGKAVLGALTLGPYGILAGSIGSNNVKLFCNSCGNKLRSTEAIRLTMSMQKYYKKNML